MGICTDVLGKKNGKEIGMDEWESAWMGERKGIIMDGWMDKQETMEIGMEGWMGEKWESAWMGFFGGDFKD